MWSMDGFFSSSLFPIADCFVRMKRGFKHYAYRDNKEVDSVEECADECFRSAYCKTFSFR